MSLNVELIRASFEQAKPIADKVADKFYEFLWGDFPQSKALFEGANMKTQKKALMNSLVYIVDHVDNADKLVPYLKKMGARHVGHQAKEEHYEWVGQSLLKTFAFFFGENWTSELESEWTKAYGFISNTMIEGAKESQTTDAPGLEEIKHKARGICHELLTDILDEEISSEIEELVRAKVRTVFFKVLEEEARELFKKSA